MSNFLSFRNAYLDRIEQRLGAINVSTADDMTLLTAGALFKMAGAVAEIDLLGPSALRLLETMTGAQLQEWLQDASNRAAFEAILASGEAMTAVAASSTAMAAVAASSTAMNAVAVSQTALAAIRRSSTAISTINANSSALSILYNVAAKFTYSGDSWSANPATLVTGNFLLVRIRQINNAQGWSNNQSTGQYIRINGSGWTATNNQSTNDLVNRTSLPHTYDNALRAVNNTSVTYYLRNSYEIAYLAA